MAEKRNNKTVRTKKTAGRKKVLLTAVIIAAVLLAAVAVAAEVIIPAMSENADKSEDTYFGTGAFYDPEKLTEEMLEGYDECIKQIYYKKDGVESLITDGNYYEIGGNAAVFFSKYIEAIKNGDCKAYSECFSDKYDFENKIDPYASGEIEFPPQRLHDIHIESLEERVDPETGLINGKFVVTYRIYCNEGNFRRDMDIYNETAPLLVSTEEADGEVKITEVSYLYS